MAEGYVRLDAPSGGFPTRAAWSLIYVAAMTTFRVGDATIDRIEETSGPMFPVDVMLPAFSADAVDNHGAEVFAQHLDPASQMVLGSIHTWLVRTPQSTILVDTCVGNHKERALPDMSGLSLPWLERLADAGVRPEDVDYVVCTHLHIDHVGWNTQLVDGEWVPTFPNARYVINQREFDFWKPDNPAVVEIGINANVYEDSIQPVFDREKMVLWDGDYEVDDSFHLEMATGHTPGHNVGWLESKGERALFSGDSMHSGMQVFEPTWNSAFCIAPEESIATRKRLVEACAEHNALLCPAHFAAPHAYRVVPRGKGLAAVGAT
jgi:glyoxylase-like metal-dependent hydrolase (beta-lactamase superfamily II)